MHNLIGRLQLFTLVVAVIALMGSSYTHAKDNLILVLDSSGSMAGQIDQRVKLDIARSAIGDLLTKLKPTTQLGLVAYGHRRKGDCGDIETIYQLGKPDAQSIMQAVGELRAVGKTPLSSAVRQAAEQLNFTEEKATVILVSDGKENCGSDPCRLGRELKAQGVDFKVHVVGFDIKTEESAGLQCLAESTGGTYVPVGSAQDLESAIYEAVQVAEAPAATPAPAPEPAPEPEPAVEPGLRIDAVVSEGGAPWKATLGLKILSAKAGLDGKRKEIANAWRVKNGHTFKNLPAGSYLVEAVLPDHRHIVRTAEIELAENDAKTVTVNLNIGQVRFDASLSEEGKPYAGGLGWTVFGLKKDLGGKRKKIANFWRVKSGQVFWLPAGKWHIEGVIADARYLTVNREIAVEAGGGEAHAFSFNAGTVRFDAFLASESAAYTAGLGWTILSKTKDLSGKHKKITNFWRVKSGSIFLLPAGSWLVDGVLADHRHVTTSMTVDVAPGSEALHEFDFKAGRIRFDVTVGGQATGGGLGLTVFGLEKDLAGKQKKIANFWRVKSGHITVLPEGKYQIDGLLADQREVKGTQQIEVTAGDEKAVTIDLKTQ